MCWEDGYSVKRQACAGVTRLWLFSFIHVCACVFLSKAPKTFCTCTLCWACSMHNQLVVRCGPFGVFASALSWSFGPALSLSLAISSSKKFVHKKLRSKARYSLSSTPNHLHTYPTSTQIHTHKHTHINTHTHTGNRSWMNVLVTTENLIACKFSFLHSACRLHSTFDCKCKANGMKF